MQLLFCNTFSDDSQGPTGNWAVVKFPCMIAVEEIRIIAHGVKAHPQLHDNQFTGKTSPNKFQVQFFSDDCSASMTTYEHVGSLEYIEGSPNRFCLNTPLYSEKLLINGWFSHITVAVYGGTLNQIGASTSYMNLNAKTPSLIIHEKPEGRSVYIRDVPDLPQLTKDLDKPEPLMASFSNRNISNQEESAGRRETGYNGSNSPNAQDMHSSYYDRRQGRNRNFEPDSGRMSQKTISNDRDENSQKTTGRKTLLPNVDPEAAAFRNDKDRLSYKEENRGFATSQPRSHNRRNTDDSKISQKERGGDQRSDGNMMQDSRAYMEFKDEVKAYRQSLDRNKGNNSDVQHEEHSQERMEGEYEEISDGETEERFATLEDIEEIVDNDVPPPSMCFNPFLMEPVQLMHFSHPAMTEFEIAYGTLLAQHDEPNVSHIGNEEDMARFESLLTKAKKVGKMEDMILNLNPEEGKEWVAVAEEIIPLIISTLPAFGTSCHEKYEEYLSLMITWVFTGLDRSVGSRQAIGTNLRMLKCGINLAQKLCLTTQDIVAFLSELKLHEKLVELLYAQHIASTVKIMIIHTLDVYLSWPSSVALYFHKNEKSVNENYATLIALVLKPQKSRVAMALSRLMNKLSLFHAMSRLKNVVQVLILEKIPSLEDQYDSEEEFLQENANEVLDEDVVLEEEEEMVEMSYTSNDEGDARNLESSFRRMQWKRKDNKGSALEEKLTNEPTTAPVPVENPALPLSAVISTADVKMTQKDVDDIIECIGLIIHTLKNLKSTILQLPKRIFPISADLSEISDKNAKACIFRMLEFYQVLVSIQALMTSPIVSGNEEIYEILYEFLDLLMSRQDGLLYLSANSGCVNCIAKHLLSSSSKLSTAEIESVGTAPHLGAKLAFHTQCIQCLDQLQTFPDVENPEMDSSDEVLEILKVLYSLTFPTFGKYWVSSVLSLDDNILPLLAYEQQVEEGEIINRTEEGKATENDNVENKEGESDVTKKKKTVRKTALGGFSVGILLITLKMSQNVSNLIRHRKIVLNTMKGTPMGRYIEEVYEWLRPLEKLPDDEEVIAPYCMEFLKNNFAKLEWNTLMTSGPGLCTVLRILCQLTNARLDELSESSALAYKNRNNFCITQQVFAGGGLTVFVDAVEQLNKCFEYPCYSQHALTTLHSFNFHSLVTALSESLLGLCRHFLDILLGTEDGKFQPRHLTKLLVHHYAGMYTVLRESGLGKLDNITKTVVLILGTFLKKSVKVASEDEEMDCRVVILKEIVSNMKEHCQAIVPGMILLSHLLPMPLPIIVKDGRFDDDAVLAHREPWERPLNVVIDQLCSFLSVGCYSICIPLLEALIPLLQQITDLSPSLATKIMASVLNTCYFSTKSKDKVPTENEVENPKDKGGDDTYSFNPHPIMVLSEIAKQPSAKATVFHCMRVVNTCLNSLWKVAREQAKDDSQHILNAAMKLANVLFNPDNALVTQNSSQRDSNTLPESCLTEIVLAACDGLKSATITTIEDSLGSLNSLLASEHCFVILKDALSKKSLPLFDVTETVLKSWTNDVVGSASVLTCFCTFVKQMCAPEEGRSNFFTKSEMKVALRWSKDMQVESHPVVQLKAKLEETDLEDNLFAQALDEITTLYENLKTSFEFKHRKRKTKENFKSPLSLSQQFKLRRVWINADFDTSFFTRSAILQGNLECSFIITNLRKEDKIQVDLTDMAEKSCPGFNLEKTLKELTESAKTTDIDKIRMEAKAKRLKKLETFSTRHGKTLTYIKRSHGLLNTNTRGRGRGRGMFSGRYYDMFRQRKQNTSRPPSMHVDDFVAADEEGGNPVASEFTPPPAPPSFAQRRTNMPFRREFIPRGRGSRGMGRGPMGNRGGFSIGTRGNTDPLSSIEFRTRTISNRPLDRFPRVRGRGRDPTRSFSPRDSFKPKPQSWSFSSPRNVSSFNSPRGFRGGRVKSLMRNGRPLLPPPPLNLTTKWGGMPPPPRRGRGYGKPRGKHIRSFTR